MLDISKTINIMDIGNVNLKLLYFTVFMKMVKRKDWELGKKMICNIMEDFQMIYSMDMGANVLMRICSGWVSFRMMNQCILEWVFETEGVGFVTMKPTLLI